MVFSAHRGLLWAVVSPVAYSASAILGKNLLITLRPHDMLFWRFAIATPVLWLLVAGRAARGGPRAGSVSFAPNIGLGFLFGFMSLTGFIALRQSPAWRGPSAPLRARSPWTSPGRDRAGAAQARIPPNRA